MVGFGLQYKEKMKSRENVGWVGGFRVGGGYVVNFMK